MREESVKIEIKDEKCNFIRGNADLSQSCVKNIEPEKETFLKSSSMKENEINRLQWNNYFEYMLSVTGFVIDLGNVSVKLNSKKKFTYIINE